MLHLRGNEAVVALDLRVLFMRGWRAREEVRQSDPTTDASDPAKGTQTLDHAQQLSPRQLK